MNKDLNKFGITEATMLAMAAKSGVKYRFGDEGMRCMLEYSQSLLALAASGGNAAPGLTDAAIADQWKTSCIEGGDTTNALVLHFARAIEAASAPNAALVAALKAMLSDFEGCYADGEPSIIAARAALSAAGQEVGHG